MTTPDPRDLFTVKGAVTYERRQQFTGRDSLVGAALDAVAIEGALVVVFGERGVGKTSFGWQVLGPLVGKRKLLSERNIETQFPVEDHPCVWLTCNDAMSDAADIIISLIETPKSPNSLRSIFPKAFEDRVVDRVIRKYKANIGVATAEINVEPTKKSSDVDLPKDRDLAAFNALNTVLARIFELYPNSPDIIFFIDEFDRIEDRAKLGVMIKALNRVRFVVIGIASSRDELIGHHKSLGRKMAMGTFPIPLFSNNDVELFFSRLPKSINFSPELVQLIASRSSGFPWVVQQLGFYSLLEARKEQKGRPQIKVSIEHYEQMIEEFIFSQLASEGFDLVKAAPAEKCILYYLGRSEKGRLDQTTLLNKMPRDLLRHFDSSIQNLIELDVLKEQGREVRIIDPVFKVLLSIAADEGRLAVEIGQTQ